MSLFNDSNVAQGGSAGSDNWDVVSDNPEIVKLLAAAEMKGYKDALKDAVDSMVAQKIIAVAA